MNTYLSISTSRKYNSANSLLYNQDFKEVQVTTKETISKVKRQPSEWEEIIANEATDKQLISEIYKQLMQLNSRKINDPIKKMGQRTK